MVQIEGGAWTATSYDRVVWLVWQESRERRRDDCEKRAKTKVKVRVSYVPVRQKGLKVLARFDNDGFYYPGLTDHCFRFSVPGQLKWGQLTFLLVTFGTWMYR